MCTTIFITSFSILFLFLFPSTSSTPISPAAAEPPQSPLAPPLSTKQQPFWQAVERISPPPYPTGSEEGDAILVKPQFCHHSCAELIGQNADQLRQSSKCVCRCPPAEPIFLQNKEGKCVQKVPGCTGRQIFFEQPHSPRPLFAPVTAIPRNGEPIAGELQIAWKESGIKMSRSGPRCTIASAQMLGAGAGIGNNQSSSSSSSSSSSAAAGPAEWRLLEGRTLFELASAEDQGRIVWTGNDSEAQSLAGSIIFLELNCAAGRNGNRNFCLAVRIEGQIEVPIVAEEPSSSGKSSSQTEAIPRTEVDHARRAEVVVIILLAILLFLSLFGSLFLWNVCWRVHKRKLVHSLQMQFLHYARQEKEKAVSDANIRYQALVKAAAGMRMNSMESGDGGMMPNFGSSSAGMQISMGNGGGPILVESLMMAGGGENGGQHQSLQQQQQQNGRRKLYFSSEFFEPQLMSNPPPMAEIFLSDLRKMVAVARERIRTRKHVPRLAPVAESEDEGAGTTTHSRTQCCWTVTVPNDERAFATSEVNGIEVEANFNQEKEEEAMPEQPMELEQALTNNDEGKENSAPQSLDSSASSGIGINGKEDEKMSDEKPANEKPDANEETGIECESQTTTKITRTEEPSEPRENDEEPAEEKGRHPPAALALATALPTGQKPQQQQHQQQQQQQQQSSVVVANNVANNVSRIPTAMTAGGGGVNSLNKSNSLNNKSPRLQLKFTAALCRRPPPPLPPRPPPQPPTAMATNGSSNGDSVAEKATTTAAAVDHEQKQHIHPPSSSIAMMKRKKVEDMNIISGEETSAEKSKMPSVPHSYAICPPSGYALDRMKKSLPRRKKVVHQPIQKPTTTIVASSAQKTADSAAAATVSVL